MAGQQGLVGLLGGREGMEHERQAEHGGGGPTAWQDSSGGELWDFFFFSNIGLLCYRVGAKVQQSPNFC